MLRCDMCHKPLKESRFKLVPFMRPDQILTVGPDCFAKAKKAEAELRQRKTPDEIAALRLKLAQH